MSDEDYRNHLANGLCLYCHEKGHLARQCPKKSTVKGKTGSDKPPGMAIFNLEMGYDDDQPVEEMDSLPLASISYCNYDTSDESMYELSNKDTKERHEFFHSRNGWIGRLMPFEPEWMEFDESRPPRKQLGDALIEKAEWILDSSQPYPGDELNITSRTGVAYRFKVCKVDDKTYQIRDSYSGVCVDVPAYRLRHPQFRMARWFAHHLANELDIEFLGSYPTQMGNALEELVECLIRDGGPTM
ncbi:hypothetical protein CC1G_11952 [Coprinopsis cinerea okayama7|uniref:CCHC-type domain-containing protein n=1 Tax=Coprinopsis cinerea (strain Okayama-7 / 130 / ATCC MYA-4618 / FGSC 9003) TaxID=240176 RepID=A8PHI3_COPC7|nr:hypothetical protein CC1G_11952 [Coprinopsis cinerea okayama7\|eukprot:XP_001841409.2 hypothetical protein CC1G_11952 [Coprinopsis cinerea okayama7\